MDRHKTCTFIGHRTIEKTEMLSMQLRQLIEELIFEHKVSIFLFGSRSQFDALCLEIVTSLKDQYPHIKRIYVRAEYPYIDDKYKKYLLTMYDDSYFPEKIINAGKCSYVERNMDMIDQSQYCVFYCDREYQLPLKKGHQMSKSGTHQAYAYALKNNKIVYNMLECLTPKQ